MKAQPEGRVSHTQEALQKDYPEVRRRGRRRPHLWYLGGRAPETEWIDNALDADYRRNPKWQDPSIVSHYTGRDLLEEPNWEPGKRGFMEQIWWPAVISFIVIVSVGLIWGLMNRASV